MQIENIRISIKKVRHFTHFVRCRTFFVRERTESVKHRTLFVRDQTESVKYHTKSVRDQMKSVKYRTESVRDRTKSVELAFCGTRMRWIWTDGHGLLIAYLGKSVLRSDYSGSKYTLIPEQSAQRFRSKVHNGFRSKVHNK